ncbi:hypothetical protein ES708_00240 [subsurface metagenome]
MQITQVQVGNVLYPLTEGEPLPVWSGVGDTIKVFYTFKYRMPETSSVRIWASLHRVTRVELAQTKDEITLVKALEWKDYEGEIDIEVGRIVSGTYSLILELPDYDVEHRIDACIEVTAAPGIGGMEMIGPILVIGLMAVMVGMLAPTMEEGFG